MIMTVVIVMVLRLEQQMVEQQMVEQQVVVLIVKRVNLILLLMVQSAVILHGMSMALIVQL